MCVVGNKKMAIWDDLNMESPLVIYDKTITKEDNHNLVDNFIAYKTACVDGGMFTSQEFLKHHLYKLNVNILSLALKKTKHLKQMAIVAIR